MRKGHGYTEQSLMQRLSIIEKIPVYPKTEKVCVICGGNRSNILTTIDMLAEDRFNGICFVKMEDKLREMSKTLDLLNGYPSSEVVTA